MCVGGPLYPRNFLTSDLPRLCLLSSFLSFFAHLTAGDFTPNSDDEVDVDGNNVNGHVYETGRPAAAHPESDDEWDANAAWTPPPQPEGEVGTKVRAIYDYVGEDIEELTFKAGDLLTQLEPEDEQGWCRGIHHASGNSGIYPACYVEEVLDDEEA